MNTPFQLTLATAADAPALTSLMRSTFMAAYGNVAPVEHLERYQALAYAAAPLADAIRRHAIEVWVAHNSGGQQAGYVQIATLPGPDPLNQGTAAIELQRCYLQPQFKGSGAAGRLMQRAKTRASKLGGERMYLSVYQHSPRAIAFYEKHAFVKIGPVRFFIDDIGFDDWLMMCELGAGSGRSQLDPDVSEGF